MKIIPFVIMGLFIVNGEATLFDFSSPDNSGNWEVVNDGVMGGLSESEIVFNPEGTVTFRGMVSLENNGGFASVRTAVELQDQKESYKGVVVRVKGDGKVYGIRFRTHGESNSYAYQFKIKTEKDNWKEFKIPFEEFNPTFRGSLLKNKPALESDNITQMGILISDKQSGDFEFTMDWIKFYQ